MKTLYSSSIISIVMAFLMVMGYHDQPIEVVQQKSPIQFSNMVKIEELLPYEKIHIEVFDGLTCDRCTDFSMNTLPKIIELATTDEIDLRLYFIPDINDESLNMAAIALKCASEQNKFWEMHSALHKNKSNLSESKMMELAEQLEIEKDSFSICLNEKRYQKAAEEDIIYASEKGITIKPSLIINHYKLIGNQPFENIQNIITKIKKERKRVSPFTLEAEMEALEYEKKLEKSDENRIQSF